MMRHQVLLLVGFLTASASGCGDNNGDSNKVDVVTDDLARKISAEMPRHQGVIGGPEYDPEHTRIYLSEHQVDPRKLMASALVLMNSAKSNDREDASRLLGLLADGAALQPLLAQLQIDPDESVRVEVVKALRHLGPAPEVEKAFAKALSDKSQRVRNWTLNVFGYDRAYKSENDVRRVMETDKSIEIRVQAANVLVFRDQKDDAIIDVFKKGLKEEVVRAECEDALEKLGKLKLPLPEECYHPIDRERYQRILKEIAKPKEFGFRSSEVQRSMKSDSKLYFEVFDVQVICPELVAPTRRRWFVAPAE
jgi:hypothetical protein